MESLVPVAAMIAVGPSRHSSRRTAFLTLTGCRYRIRRSHVIDGLRVSTGSGTWVFPSPRGQGCIEKPQKGAERPWKRAGVKDATLHDLRRTCASFIAAPFGENGRFMVKKVLNHADRDGATTVYDRFTYDGPKRRALEAWGRRLVEILEGMNQAKVLALWRR